MALGMIALGFSLVRMLVAQAKRLHFLMAGGDKTNVA